MATPPATLTVLLPYESSARQTMLRVRACMRHGSTDYRVIIVGNRIDPKESAKLTALIRSYPHIRLFDYPGTAGITTLYDRAARKAGAGYVLVLSPGMQFTAASGRLVGSMLVRAGQADIGAVGCLQLDAKKRIRHAGIFRLDGHRPARLYYRQPIQKAIRYIGTRSYPYDIRRSRHVMAADGVLLISLHRFREAGGFVASPSDASLETAEFELCRRLDYRGWKTWYQADGHFAVTGTLDGDGFIATTLTDEVDPYSIELTATNLPKPRMRVNLMQLLKGRPRPNGPSA